jgi:hypothetical protein
MTGSSESISSGNALFAAELRRNNIVLCRTAEKRRDELYSVGVITYWRLVGTGACWYLGILLLEVIITASYHYWNLLIVSTDLKSACFSNYKLHAAGGPDWNWVNMATIITRKAFVFGYFWNIWEHISDRGA